MNNDQIFQTRQAVEMLIAAFSDVEQTLQDFVEADNAPDLQQIDPSLHWQPADYRPPEGKRVVVVTKTGCVYFDCAINGHLLPNVKWWLVLPDIPE